MNEEQSAKRVALDWLAWWIGLTIVAIAIMELERYVG